jgi:oligosaccharide repeat unit polymerase
MNMNEVTLALYIVFGLVFLIAPVILFKATIFGKIYHPLVFFSAYFSLTYYFVPISAAYTRDFSFQGFYSDQTMQESLLYLTLFGFSTYIAFFVGSSALYKRFKNSTFDYKNWQLIPKNVIFWTNAVAGVFIAFSVSVFLYFILTEGLGRFMQNRIIYLSGLGYITIILQWPMILLMIVLVNSLVQRMKTKSNLPWRSIVLLLSITIFAGLVSGSRTNTLIPLIMLGFSAIIIIYKGKIPSSIQNRSAVVLTILLIFGVSLGSVREQVFTGRDTDFQVDSITASDVLSGAYGEFENVWWITENAKDAPLLYGNTFLAAVVGLVPRNLWPDKPLGGGPYLVNMIRPGSYDLVNGTNLTSFTTGLPTEAMMNFGIPGFVIVGMFYGFFLSYIWYFFQNIQNALQFALWIILLYRGIFALKAEFFGNMSAIFALSAPLIICYIIWRWTARRYIPNVSVVNRVNSASD